MPTSARIHTARRYRTVTTYSGPSGQPIAISASPPNRARMPIVDSSRPSHSAPPLEPWLTGSALLLLFCVGVIEMNGLVVVVDAERLRWLAPSWPGSGSLSTRNVVKSSQDRLAGGVGEPPRHGAGAARHRRVDRDRDDEPVGVDFGRAGVLRLRRRAAREHDDRSVVAAQLLVEREHDRCRATVRASPRSPGRSTAASWSRPGPGRGAR